MPRRSAAKAGARATLGSGVRISSQPQRGCGIPSREVGRKPVGVVSQTVTLPAGTAGDRSQIVTGFQKHRDPRFPPYAFTEHGDIMAANVLNSSRAVQMSLFVVRAFVKMRRAFSDTRELARKLAALEKELKSRLDTHEVAIVEVLRRVMDIFDPPPQPEPKRIGFHTDKESDR
jgi:hypothetical protein